MKVLYALSDAVIMILAYAWAFACIAVKVAITYFIIEEFDVQAPYRYVLIVITAAFCIRNLKRASYRSKR